jgi:replication-associated recombination protein RarA
MSKYDLRTKKNYDFFECSSAMQKCIRRGLEQDAMYWAVELYESGYGEYVWKRLRIMSSEDIGLAEPLMPANIWALFRSYQEQAKKKEDKNEPQRLFLTHAVLLLCRAKKSRMIDWTLIWAWLTHPFRRLDIPDYAHDKHNERGRRLGRSWAHFFDEGTRLDPHWAVDYEDDMRQRAMRAISDPSGNGLFD